MKGASVNQAHKEALDPRVAFDKEVERIRGLPQTQRWRECKRLLFSVKPDLVAVDQGHVAAIRQERDMEMLSSTGASKSGDIRRLYSMPQYMYAMLHLIDPEFTRLQEDPDTAKKTNLKIAEVFPEYCLASRI